jgi:transcriptional regulator with XRE-family HTH domain
LNDPALTEWLSRPGGIVDRLRDMRSRAGLRGRDLAEPIGWQPSKVSKIEHATQLPTETDVRAWAGACGFPGEADALVEMLAEVPALRLEFVRQAAHGDAPLQAEHDQMARDATVVRCFETAIIPGLLQVPGYARHVMAACYDYSGYEMGTLAEAVAGRIKRQQLFYEDSLNRRFEFLIAESALLWRMAPPPVMRAQLDRLLSTMGLDNVRIGIVPLRNPGTIPMSSFIMYDDLVVVETFNDSSTFPRGATELYLGIVERMWRTAAEGDEARRLILKAIDDLDDE